jgi:hypothetical protein
MKKPTKQDQRYILGETMTKTITERATHGEIVTWSANGSYKQTTIVQALRNNSLNESEARNLVPRNAFTRACHSLSEKRIIRKLTETKEHITFQFTQEYLNNDKFEYAYETTLTLDKQTGDIACALPELATKAQDAMADTQGERTASDITRIIQRLFTKNADLFSVRNQGGAYFVPKHYETLLERIQKFGKEVGVSFNRFPVATGTAAGDASVRECVVNGINDMVQELLGSIDGFDEDTNDNVLERAMDRVRKLKHKVEAYAEFLSDKSTELTNSIEQAKELLAQKMTVSVG